MFDLTFAFLTRALTASMPMIDATQSALRATPPYATLAY